jgi:hypothetical protein
MVDSCTGRRPFDSESRDVPLLPLHDERHEQVGRLAAALRHQDALHPFTNWTSYDERRLSSML